jgi:predicted MFS family arabinose efflux permease
MDTSLAIDVVAADPVAYPGMASLGLALAGGLAWLSFMALPFEISELIARHGLTAEAASWIASGEVLALACAAGVCGRFVARIDRRLFTIAGLVLAFLSSVLSACPVDLVTVIVARIIFGAALGVVSATSNALAGLHPRPERIYAYVMVGLSVIFCIIMSAEPVLDRYCGAVALFTLEAVLIAGFGWTAIHLPREAEPAAVVARRGVRLTPRLWILLAAIFLLFLANSVIWAFADQAAARIGVTPAVVGPLFTISGVLMLGGGLGATWLGDRRGYLGPLLAGCLGQALSSVTIYAMQDATLYVVGVLIFNATLVFALPYAQAVLAELDESTTAVAYSGAAVNFGAALGPALGALLIPYGFRFIGYCGVALSLAGIAMVARGTRTAERRLAQRRRAA